MNRIRQVLERVHALSLEVAFLSATIALVMGTLAGYVLARFGRLQRAGRCFPGW